MKGIITGLFLFLVAVSIVKESSALSDVCYSYLGCFSMNYPWYSFMRPLPSPQSPEAIDTQFYLYTRAKSNSYLVTKLPNITFTGSDYDGNKTTYFLIQGFVSNSNQPWILAMKDAILKQFDANVFIVDWSKGSTQINYLQVASNARVVGAEVIRFAKYLLSDKGAAVSRFHFVGHSIGAHISGYVGKAIPGIARITALEATQPGFEGFSTAVRLVNSDAVFVEAIHTNARPFIPLLGFGYMVPIGHVDFYVNGGCDQPGCLIPPVPNVTITSLADLGKVTVDVLQKWIFCPHSRAFQVFTASVANKGCTFWGHKADYIEISLSILSGGYLTQLMDLGECSKDACSPLGLQSTIYPARGVFLVKTTGSDPYCIAEPKSDAAMEKYKTEATAPI